MKLFIRLTVLVALVGLACTVNAEGAPQRRRSTKTASELLAGDFSIVTSIDGIPGSVIAALSRDLKEKPLRMANPDQTFNVGDVGRPGKRLVFAGVSSDKCFVHYEEGGIAHVYHLLVYRLEDKQATLVWAGAGFHARSFQELRTAVKEGKFRSTLN